MREILTSSPGHRLSTQQQSMHNPCAVFCTSITLLVQKCRQPYCSCYGCYSCTELCATSSAMFLEVVTKYYVKSITSLNHVDMVKAVSIGQEVNHNASFKNHTCITKTIKYWWCVTVTSIWGWNFPLRSSHLAVSPGLCLRHTGRRHYHKVAMILTSCEAKFHIQLTLFCKEPVMQIHRVYI